MAAFLRPLPPAPPNALQEDVTDGGIADVPPEELSAEYASVVGAIRRFRAGIADALDAAVQRLLVYIGENVLARELELAPADIAGIVAKARERASAERVIAVRVHPTQRDLLAAMQVEVRQDERLRLGDVVIELHSGTIDLRLRTRLATALAACGP